MGRRLCSAKLGGLHLVGIARTYRQQLACANANCRLTEIRRGNFPYGTSAPCSRIAACSLSKLTRKSLTAFMMSLSCASHPRGSRAGLASLGIPRDLASGGRGESRPAGCAVATFCWYGSRFVLGGLRHRCLLPNFSSSRPHSLQGLTISRASSYACGLQRGPLLWSAILCATGSQV